MAIIVIEDEGILIIKRQQSNINYDKTNGMLGYYVSIENDAYLKMRGLENPILGISQNETSYTPSRKNELPRSIM
jgi:hypothetical protein